MRIYLHINFGLSTQKIKFFYFFQKKPANPLVYWGCGAKYFFGKTFFEPKYPCLSLNIPESGLSRGRAREDNHRMLTDAEFAKMLEDCRENGGVNDGILRAVESIAKRALHGSQHRDDIVQAVLIRFCKVWRRIDCSQNVSAYLAAMIRNEKRMFFRSLNRKQRLFVNESRFATGLEFVAAEKFKTREVRAICC